MDKELGKAIPYGVYDLSQNEGWVSVGIDHDTARFAMQAIARWWQQRQSLPPLESGIAGAGGSMGDPDPCQSFSTGDQ